MKIAIIDTIGLTYDGNTLSNRGLGGSESAVILMSKELAKLGFDVTVFNNCIDSHASPGIYDRVRYIDHKMIKDTENLNFDIVISSRSIAPFVPETYYPDFQWPICPSTFKDIIKNAKLKVLWLHDTFCKGDFLLEWLFVNNYIDEMFTLSDFHTSYVANADHGGKRMFEVLKNKIFMTRNGISKYHESVDINAKDPNLYVYNASVTKGMIPLVERVWPKVKQHLPNAKLKIIGGYYRFRDNEAPDEQEKKWRDLANSPQVAALDIEFTGIIKQSQIADILSKASFFIYPPAFPETFGISTIESLAYNTPVITSNFGALEETAIDMASYKIDYPIEPNSLFPNVKIDEQVDRFVHMVVSAANDRYKHYQKMNYCNIIKDICTWESVSKQWKQHFYKKLGKYLTRKEYQEASKINSRVREIFGRRFTNSEENYIPRNMQQKLVVIMPMYNAENYISKAIDSVITQDYDNWELYVIDDYSSDRSYDIAKSYEHLDSRVHVMRNQKNMGAVYNQISTIKNVCSKEDIIILLDGDDSLVNNNQIFHYYNNLYDGTTEFTYGSCWSMVDNIPLVGQEYDLNVKRTKTYKSQKFPWNVPYTHLRTFKAFLIINADNKNFMDDSGEWYKAGGDISVFYTALYNSDPNKIKAVQDIMVNYNDAYDLNDYKINGTEQTRNANQIMSRG